MTPPVDGMIDEPDVLRRVASNARPFKRAHEVALHESVDFWIMTRYDPVS